MADDIANLSQEEMIELAKKVNEGTPDVTLSDEENAARLAAAKAKEGNNGSKTAEELAAEAAGFKGEEEPNADDVFGKDGDDNKDGNDGDDAGNGDDNDDDANDTADGDDADDAGDDEFPTSDDPSLNAALGLMKAAGMTTEKLAEHFGEAINTGDLSKIDREALNKELGEDKAELVMAGVTKWSADAGAATLEAARQVQQSVGGAENWAKMTAWAKQAAKSDPALKKEIQGITDMLNGNEMSRKLGAQEFKRLYNADKNNVTLGGKTVEGDAPAKEKIKPMTGTEAYQAKEKLNRQRQLGKVSLTEYRAGMAKIQAARNAGR
jgi:hypothetical protein